MPTITTRTNKKQQIKTVICITLFLNTCLKINTLYHTTSLYLSVSFFNSTLDNNIMTYQESRYRISNVNKEKIIIKHITY